MKICIANITFLKRDMNGGVVENVRNHSTIVDTCYFITCHFAVTSPWLVEVHVHDHTLMLVRHEMRRGRGS